MTKFNFIGAVIIILLVYGIKSEDLTIEVRSIICNLIASNNVCNNTVMRSYVCNNCELECKGKIDPDCNTFIGECKDYYSYCPDVVSQCHVSFMTSFLYKYCPVTCEQCVPTNNNDTAGEIPIEINGTSNVLLVNTTTTTTSIPIVNLLPFVNSSNIIESTKLK